MSFVDILTQIDSVGNITMESEYNVLCALFDSYDKAFFIAENYVGDDIDNFTIFNESWIQESKKNANSNDTNTDTKFTFRQTKKDGTKESFVKSLIMLIPRLVKLARNVHAEKLHKKKMKRLTKHAKKLNTDITKMDPGQIEIFNAIINSPSNNKKEMKKIICEGINRYRIRNWLLKMGLKAGGGAIVTGGIAYIINTKGQLISQKVEEYKGAVLKKVDDVVLDPIRNAGNAAAEKITVATEKTVEKISAIAEKVENAMKKVCEFIKKIFQNIQKFFRISIFNFDKANDDILCKVNVKTGSLKVTLNLDQWMQWLDASRIFITNAAKFISHDIEHGKIVKNEANKRTGAIMDFQKAYDDSKIFKGSDAEDAVTKYRENLNQIFDKTKILKQYEPISDFAEQATQVADRMDKICSIAKELSDKYEKRVNNPALNSKWSNVEQTVFQTLRGILDTQIQLTNAIDAVNEYITGVNDITETMIGNESNE